MKKFSYFEKILLSIIIFIFITITIIMMYKNKSLKNIEGFNDFKDKYYKNNARNEENKFNDDTLNKFDNIRYEAYIQQEGFTSVVEGLDIGGAFRDLGNSIKGPFEDLGNKIKGPIDGIKNVMEMIKDAFVSIPKRFRNLGDAFRLVDDGIKSEFINLGKSLKIGTRDIFNIIGSAGKCGIQKIMNFRVCVIWYILDMIGTIIFNIFIEFPIFLFYCFTNYNLQPHLNKFIGYIKIIDNKIYDYTSYHFMHYPDNIIQNCYTCSIQNEVDMLNYDFKVEIPRLMREANDDFYKAGNKFKSVFANNPDGDDSDNNVDVNENVDYNPSKLTNMILNTKMFGYNNCVISIYFIEYFKRIH